MLDLVDRLMDGGTATHPDFGVVTSCPSNMGTGMRCSVHVPLPHLCSDGSEARVERLVAPLGLLVTDRGSSVRGKGVIGADGTVDVSPCGRFCTSEAAMVIALYRGLVQLKQEEDATSAREGRRERKHRRNQRLAVGVTAASVVLVVGLIWLRHARHR